LYVTRGSPGALPIYWDALGDYHITNTSLVSTVRYTGVLSVGVEEIPLIVVTGRYYGIMWGTQADVQNMRIRYSEPDYLNFTSPNEWVGLTMSWIGRRYSMEFFYPSKGRNVWDNPGNARTDWDNLPYNDQITMPLLRRGVLRPPKNSLFGTASYPYSPRNNTIALLLNTNITTLSKRLGTNNGVGTPAGISNAFTLDMTYNLCPPEGCNYVPRGALGDAVLWSRTFTSLEKNQDLTIGPTQNVILDVSPVALGTINIYGRLEFDPTAPANKTITLTAKNLVVFGSLAIGSPTKPFRAQAKIVLDASLLDDDVIVDNKQVLGHKAIVVFGNVTMYGTQRNSWTRLATTVDAQSRTLVVTENTGWKVNSSIVISMTEYSSWNGSATQVISDRVSWAQQTHPSTVLTTINLLSCIFTL
jgi:G8 domain